MDSNDNVILLKSEKFFFIFSLYYSQYELFSGCFNIVSLTQILPQSSVLAIVIRVDVFST